MFVFVHIPKTAGTALADIFSYSTSRKVYFDYTGWEKMQYYCSPDPDISRHRNFIERNFCAIFGHFTLDKYYDFFSESKYLICFRDPVDRIISHYNHVANDRELSDPLTKYVSDEDGIVDFASDPVVCRAQIAHMGSRSIKDLDFIFFQDSMAEGLSVFDRKFGMSLSMYSSHRSNDASARKAVSFPNFDVRIRDKLAKLAEEEYDFLASARTRYNEIIASNY